jgi:hypothetical protein
MTTFDERYREFEDLGVATFEPKLLATLGNCAGPCCASPFDRRCHVRCSRAPQSMLHTRGKSHTSRQCTVPFKNYKARHAAVPA